MAFGSDPSKTLIPQTGYSETCVADFLKSSKQIPRKYLEQRPRPLPHPFQFIIHSSPCPWMLQAYRLATHGINKYNTFMRCYNPSVRYSAIKPLNNSSFGYRYSQISRNVNMEHIIVKQSNITCPSISYSKPNSIIKLAPQ
jgi:hypothetical protein